LSLFYSNGAILELKLRAFAKPNQKEYLFRCKEICSEQKAKRCLALALP
jgi:hypothetical protein